MVQSNDTSPKGAGSTPDLPDKTAVLDEAAVLIVEPDAARRQDIEDQLRAAGFARLESVPDEEGATKACRSDATRCHPPAGSAR